MWCCGSSTVYVRFAFQRTDCPTLHQACGLRVCWVCGVPCFSPFGRIDEKLPLRKIADLQSSRDYALIIQWADFMTSTLAY